MPNSLPKEVIRFTAVGAPEAVADSRVRRFKISSSAVARDGHTLATGGWELDNFRANPMVLAAHDSKRIESVIGNAVDLSVRGDDLFADIDFIPADINPLAEMTLRMVDAGYLRATSVGFIPLEGKPAKGRGAGAFDFSKQELLEISIVPVGSLPDALLAARAAGIDTAPALEWAKRILETEMPKPAERTLKTFKRDLYDCGWLAQLLQSLACLQSCAEWEAENEDDNSPVPGMLAEAIKTLGGILIAMTAEEVAELIGEEVAEERAADTAGQRAVKALGRMLRAPKARILSVEDVAEIKRQFQAEASGGQLARAGKTISAASEQCIRDAHSKIREGADMLMCMVEPSPEDSEADIDGERTAARAKRERQAKAAKAFASLN